MTVYVNERKVDLPGGMSVRHALIGAGLLAEVEKGKGVFDQWGNRIGLDGALTDGDQIFVR